MGESSSARKVERERLVRERREWSSVWAWVRMERVVSEIDWMVLVCATLTVAV